jgi:hypothetical protein
MLYLNPPYHVIDGVTVLPDHADPRQYYFMPANPRLTRLEGAGGDGAPSLQLIKYRSHAQSGGILDFDVNLGVDEDVLDNVAREIRSRERLRDVPRLAPIPLVDGTVRMMMLGRTSDAPEGDRSEEGLFRVGFAHHAKPSLYGSNQAAFSVELNPEATTLVEEALQGALSPIGIIYSLSFWGLMPAYHVRLNVDWNRVQHHMSEQFQADTIIFSTDISKVVDELIEERIIEFEVDGFIPEGAEDFGGVEGRKERAVNQVREMITESFFEPTLDPVRPGEPDGWSRFTDTVESLALVGATGGLSGIASFTYREADIQRIDRKSLAVNMRERTAVQRSIHPQGHLAGLWHPLRSEGHDVERFIRSVDLNDPWFEKRALRVIARTDFERDEIVSIQAELRYGEAHRTALLEPERPEATLEWPSRLNRGGMMMRPVQARYQVRIRGTQRGERPRLLESDEVEVTSDVLEIDPRDLFELEEIPVVATDFPWDRYHRVEVHLRYHDEAGRIRLDDVLTLDEENPERSWRRFAVDRERRSYECRIVYRSRDHRDVEGAWTERDDPQISIRDPFPRKRRVELVPAVSWDEVRQIFVDVTYDDPENDVHRERAFRMNAEHPNGATFEVDLVDPDRRNVEYRVTMLFANGRVRTIPASVTRENRVFLRADMLGHRVIRVRPDPAIPLGSRVREVTASLSYEDAGGGLSYNDEFRFSDPADERFFEFDFVDEFKTAYRYRSRFQFSNGMARQSDWSDASDGELLIPAL